MRFIFIIVTIIFFLKPNQIYSQTPKELLFNVYKIIKVGKWLDKFTVNNEKVKVYYIQVETTAPNFDQAKETGFQLAIQEALGSFVTSEKVVKFDEVTRNEIIMYSGGYVQDFEIIKENKSLDSTTLTMDVWISESKIANRLLNTSVNEGELDGEKIAAQLSTIVKDQDDANKLLQIILKDFPLKAFVLDIKKTNFKTLREGATIVKIPIEISWSKDYLDSLKEALILLRDGDELRFANAVDGWLTGQTFNDGVTISVGSKTFAGAANKGVDANFKNTQIIELFYQHFNNKKPVIKISLNDDFENEKVVDCFYLQWRANHFTKDYFDFNLYLYERLFLEEFYEFNTDRAHFEINEKFKQKKSFQIEFTSQNLEQISEITKVKASVIEASKCKPIK